jgi:GST-like protein
MYTLFGANRSGSVAIEAALQLCHTAYQWVPASSWEEGPGTDRLKQVNPPCQVPTLVTPDGAVLTESAAILIWLGLAFPASGLLSAHGPTRAQQVRSLAFIASNCYSAIGIIDYPERWLPGSDNATLARLVEGAQARLYQQWTLFSDLFGAGCEWQPGTPGGPELLAAVVTRWSGTRNHLAIDRPAFLQSLEAIDRHPVMKDVLARRWG